MTDQIFPQTNNTNQGLAVAGPGLLSHLQFQDRDEVITPYTHKLDENALDLALKEYYENFEDNVDERIINGIQEMLKTKRLQDPHKNDWGTVCRLVTEEFKEGTVPEHVYNDLFTLYYNPIDRLSFEDRTESNLAKFKLIEKLNNTVLKVISYHSPVKTMVAIRALITHMLITIVFGKYGSDVQDTDDMKDLMDMLNQKQNIMPPMGGNCQNPGSGSSSGQADPNGQAQAGQGSGQSQQQNQSGQTQQQNQQAHPSQSEAQNQGQQGQQDQQNQQGQADNGSQGTSQGAPSVQKQQLADDFAGNSGQPQSQPQQPSQNQAGNGGQQGQQQPGTNQGSQTDPNAQSQPDPNLQSQMPQHQGTINNQNPTQPNPAQQGTQPGQQGNQSPQTGQTGQQGQPSQPDPNAAQNGQQQASGSPATPDPNQAGTDTNASGQPDQGQQNNQGQGQNGPIMQNDPGTNTAGSGNTTMSSLENQLNKLMTRMYDTNQSQQLMDSTVQNAKENIERMEEMMDQNQQQELWDDMDEYNKELMDRIDPAKLKHVEEELKKIKVSGSSLKDSVKRLLDKSINYFSSKADPYYENLLDSDNIAGLVDYPLLHPKLRKIFIEDIMVRNERKVGKIDNYVDISGSMGASSGARDVNGDIITRNTLAKAITYKLKQMDLLNDLYTFEYSVHPMGNELMDVLLMDGSGGTDLENVVAHIQKTGRNALVTTDACDSVDTYSPYAFFIGVAGSDFTRFSQKCRKQYVDGGQLIVFDGKEVMKVGYDGRPIRKEMAMAA